ncbi:SMC-Scp complex subunit ScpB [Ferruginivarius sediminum]|uniref:SMC-Scp complex subunit ScpB n=1 Tax=Ferruginivarius sediminum TaxID=2661937 RepID=A0A369T815_9PROT|nr:SMC-Scp complex subunit ScpB [Ferruginivarius sediminum]RDD61418.1 SMC-Scp complex subunit ScpB [Ferruginivarius sediminum]
MSDDRFERLRILEAVLFASGQPRTPTELARHLPDGDDIEELLAELRTLYANRGIELRQIGKGWAFRTAEDLAGKLRIEQTVTRKLSRAAIETLAVVAYHQPVTRAEIEEIRGVGLSKGTLDTLLEADWIRPFGRRQTPGRPVTWGTTQAFLDHFGLSRIGDLPGIEELKAAGLIDARPALTALTARGELTEVGQGEDVESKGAAPQDAEDGLDPDFGEDLVPEDREDED